MKALDQTTAERFLAAPDSVDLSTYGSIDAEAAQIIANYRGHTLNVSGLEALNLETATALSKAKAGELWLDGIGSISNEVASALAHSPSRIQMFGLLEASDEALENLASGAATIDLGCASCLLERFNRIIATSSRVAEKKRTLAENEAREVTLAEADRVGSAAIRRLTDLTLKAAEKPRSVLTRFGSDFRGDFLAATAVGENGTILQLGLHRILSASCSNEFMRSKGADPKRRAKFIGWNWSD